MSKRPHTFEEGTPMELDPPSPIALQTIPGQFPDTIYYVEPGFTSSSIFTTSLKLPPSLGFLGALLATSWRLAQKLFRPQVIRAEPIYRNDGSRKKILLDAGLADAKPVRKSPSPPRPYSQGTAIHNYIQQSNPITANPPVTPKPTLTPAEQRAKYLRATFGQPPTQAEKDQFAADVLRVYNQLESGEITLTPPDMGKFWIQRQLRKERVVTMSDQQHVKLFYKDDAVDEMLDSFVENVPSSPHSEALKESLPSIEYEPESESDTSLSPQSPLEVFDEGEGELLSSSPFEENPLDELPQTPARTLVSSPDEKLLSSSPFDEFPQAPVRAFVPSPDEELPSSSPLDKLLSFSPFDIIPRDELLQTPTPVNDLPAIGTPIPFKLWSSSPLPQGTPGPIDVPDITINGLELESSDFEDDPLEQIMPSNELCEELRQKAIVPPKPTQETLQPAVQPSITSASVTAPTAPPSIQPLNTPLDDSETSILEDLADKYRDMPLDTIVGSSRLTVHDFKTLLPNLFKGSALAWLNDNVINEYIGILVEHAKVLEGYQHKKGGPAPPVHNFASQWYTSAAKNMFTVKNWAHRKQLGGDQLFDSKLVIFPVCLASHWRLVAIKPQSREIHYLDSLHSHDDAVMKIVFGWLQQNLGEFFNEEHWKVTEGQPSTRQVNSSDCGVFACLNALALLREEGPGRVIVSDGMEDARRRMAMTIINKRPTTEF